MGAPPAEAPEAGVDLGTRRVTTDRELYDPVTLLLLVGGVVGSCVASSELGGGLTLLILLAPVAVALWRTVEHSRLAALSRRGSDLVMAGNSGTARLPLASVRSAHVAARYGAEGRPAVVCTLADRRTLALEAADHGDARALFAALGFDASQRRAVFRGVRLFHRLMATMLAPSFAGILIAFVLLGWPLLPVELVWAIWAALCVPLWLVMVPVLDTAVGLDGVTVGGRFGGRFYPWSEVAEVDEAYGELRLRLRTGRVRGVWCNPEDGTVLPAVVAAAREALAAYQGAAADAAAAALLDRNGRSIAEWRAAMGGLLHRPNDYRSAPVDRDRVRALLADPSTPVERRIGAALALAHDAEDGRTRVRVAAEVVADPSARAALTGIADGADIDAAVEAALRGVTRSPQGRG